jgi:hypothetical protein
MPLMYLAKLEFFPFTCDQTLGDVKGHLYIVSASLQLHQGHPV